MATRFIPLSAAHYKEPACNVAERRHLQSNGKSNDKRHPVALGPVHSDQQVNGNYIITNITFLIKVSFLIVGL